MTRGLFGYRTRLVTSLFESDVCTLEVAVLHLTHQKEDLADISARVTGPAETRQEDDFESRIFEKIWRARGSQRNGVISVLRTKPGSHTQAQRGCG
jgi:hypothetical protein